MTRTAIAGLALALTLGFAGASQAQQPVQQRQHRQGDHQEWQGRGQQRGFKALLKGIKLTDQQKAQLKELRQKEGKKGDKDKFAKVREEMREARQKGDTAKVREIRADARKEMQERREDRIKEIRELLTPEQRTIFDQNVSATRNARG